MCKIYLNCCIQGKDQIYSIVSEGRKKYDTIKFLQKFFPFEI